ncbi:hypothetical protein PV325_012228, partial [Microctonus aethiopoides]
MNDLSVHAHLLQSAGGLGSNPTGSSAGGFPWFMPPVFPSAWPANTQKIPQLQALLSQYMTLPFSQNLTSLGSLIPIGLNTANVLAHSQFHQQQQQQQQREQQINSQIHSLVDVQDLPQNLKLKHERDDDSMSSDDEIRRQSAQVLRVKAEEIIRKS